MDLEPYAGPSEEREWLANLNTGAQYMVQLDRDDEPPIPQVGDLYFNNGKPIGVIVSLSEDRRTAEIRINNG